MNRWGKVIDLGPPWLVRMAGDTGDTVVDFIVGAAVAVGDTVVLWEVADGVWAAGRMSRNP